MGWVSNEPLREAFLRSGRSCGDLARELGYPRKEASRVLRRLGFIPNSGEAEPQRYVQESTALLYAEILGLDPHELDL